MADERKGIALVILGIVAIIAIVGLVLLFTNAKKGATGQGIYGGAMKEISYPYWVGRGTPANRPGEEYLWPSTASKDLTTHWNYYGSPKRDPKSDVPSALTKCGNRGFLISYNDNQRAYYENIRDFTVVETGDKAGLCVYPGDYTMVGGIAS